MKKKLRQIYVRLLRCPGAPQEVARGLALGVFVAMLPIFQMPVALLIAEILRRAFGIRMSRAAAAIGVFFTNPLTGPILYGLAWLTGRTVLQLFVPAAPLPEHLSLSTDVLLSMGPAAWQMILALAIGGVITGAPFAVIFYRLTFRACRCYQQKRAERRLQARLARVPVAA